MNDEAPTSAPWLRKYYELSDDTVADEPSSSSGPLPDAGDRYTVIRELGGGGAKSITCVEDGVTTRQVAMATMHNRNARRERVRRFLREARITAFLEHPNIVPVYDIGHLPDGAPYFTMRLIRGETLASLIQRLKNEPATNKGESPGHLLDVFQRVCDAVAYAHAKGIIHLDLKPENIQVSDLGEIVVLDWGLAKIRQEVDDETLSAELAEVDRDSVANTRDGEIKGTPGYMAPEQAMGVTAEKDERSDVYALGATLYSMLTWCRPRETKTSAEDIRADLSTPIIPPRERAPERAIPPPLEAIVLKAMATEPEGRYQSVVALRDDIRQYQDGRAVSAYRDTLFGYVSRVYRRNRRAYHSLAAILLVLLVCGTIIVRQHLREVASWGNPIWEEGFEDGEAWRQRWVVLEGTPERRDGQLISTKSSNGSQCVVFKQRLANRAAIEFDGTILPGNPPGDLSAVWFHEDLSINDEPLPIHVGKTIYFQTAAYHNSFAAIRSGPVEHRYAYAPVVLEEGRRYRIRAEIDGDRYTLSIDGKIVCECTLTIPIGRGYLGFYNYLEGKAIDNVRIYTKSVPEVVSVLDRGDMFFRRGRYDDAQWEYEQIIRSHPSSGLSETATYRKGLCLHKRGQHEAAYTSWESLLGSRFDGQVKCHLVERTVAQGKHQQALQDMAALYVNGDNALRSRVGNAWLAAVKASPDNKTHEQYLAFWSTYLSQDGHFNLTAASLLQQIGRTDEVLTRFPAERYLCAQILVRLERFEEALSKYPDQREACAKALLALNRPEEVLAKYRDNRSACAAALLQLGRFQEVLDNYQDQPGAYREAMTKLAAGK